jgi:hypothetical protein
MIINFPLIHPLLSTSIPLQIFRNSAIFAFPYCSTDTSVFFTTKEFSPYFSDDTSLGIPPAWVFPERYFPQAWLLVSSAYPNSGSGLDISALWDSQTLIVTERKGSSSVCWKLTMSLFEVKGWKVQTDIQLYGNFHRLWINLSKLTSFVSWSHKEKKPLIYTFICGRQSSCTYEVTLTDNQRKAVTPETPLMGATPDHCGSETRWSSSRKTESRRYRKRGLRVGARETVVRLGP